MAANVRTIRLNVDAADLRRAAKEANYHLKSIEKQAIKTRVSMTRIMGMGAIMFYSTAARRVANFAVELGISAEKTTLLSRRLETLTKDSDALSKIVSSANAVGASFDELSKVVGRFAVATKNSFSTDDMISWTEGIIKSGRLVGNTQKEITSGLTQLSQSLSAGALMGDEYRSVMENLPLLAIEIRKQFEGDTRALKELSSQGLLTTEVVVRAMENLNDSMEGLPGLTDTVEAKLAVLGNSWELMLASMMDATGNWVTYTIGSISKVFNYIAEVMGTTKEEAIAKTKASLIETNEEIARVVDNLGRMKKVLDHLNEKGERKGALGKVMEGTVFGDVLSTSNIAHTEKRIATLTSEFEALNKQRLEHIELLTKSTEKTMADEKALDDAFLQKTKELELLKEINGVTDKSIKIRDRFNKLRSKVTGMIDLEDQAVNLKVIFGMYEKIDAAEKIQLDNLIKKKEVIESTPSQCERIKTELDCEEKLLHSYDSLAKATYDRSEAIKDLDHAMMETSMSEGVYLSSLKEINDEFKDATTTTKEFAKETKVAMRSASREATAFEVTWKRTIKRLDDGFADLWGDFVRGSIDAMDFIKEAAYDFLAEMLHAFTTQKLVMSFGATFGAAGVASAAGSGIASSGVGGLSGASVGGIGDMFTLIKDGLFGTGLNDAITQGVNSAIGNTFGMTPFTGTGTSGFLGTNVGMMGSGILAGYLGDEIFGGYGGAGASIGATVGSAFGPLGTLAGGVLGGAVGGLFGGSSKDTSADLTIGAGFQPSRATSYGDNDAYGTIQSLFGGLAYSTSHDAFGSQADATNFENAIKQSFVPYDDMIANVLGEEVTASIVSGMNNFVINTKYEEPGQWEAGLKSVFEQRFNKIADLVGGEFNSAFDAVFSETGSYQQAVEAASQAVLRTSLIAEGADVNLSQNRGSYTTAYDYFAEEFTKGISLATEEGMAEFTQELNNVIALISNARSSADYSSYFDSAAETNFAREKPKTSEKLLILGEYLMSVNAVLPALNQNMLELTIQGGMWAKNLAVLSGGMDQFTAKASFYYENFFTETEQLQDTFDNSAKSIADFNAKFNQNVTDKDSLRVLAESIDLTDKAGRKLYSSLLDLAPVLVANGEAFEALNPIIDLIDHTEELNTVREDEISFLQQAIEVWSDLKIGVGEFIDSIKLSDLSPLTRMEKFYEAQSQYLSNYNSALSGNQYAQENYTQFAEQYLTAGRDTYASSSNYEDIYNQVLSNAGTIDADLGSRIAQTQNAITVQTDNADVIEAINQLLIAMVQTQSEGTDEITDAIRDTTNAILNQDNDPVSTLI